MVGTLQVSFRMHFRKAFALYVLIPQDLKLSPDSISYALESTANGPFATPRTLALGRMVNEMFGFKDPVADPVHLSIGFQGLVSVHQVFDHLDAKFGMHRGSLEFNQQVYQIAAGVSISRTGQNHNVLWHGDIAQLSRRRLD